MAPHFRQAKTKVFIIVFSARLDCYLFLNSFLTPRFIPIFKLSSHTCLTCCSSNMEGSSWLIVLCYNCFCCFEHPTPRFPFKYLCKSHILRFNLIYQLGQSAIVKYHRLGDFLTMRNVLAASSGSQKFKIKVFAGLLSSWPVDDHLLTSS